MICCRATSAVDALLDEGGDEEVGEADGGGAGAEEQDPLLLELPPVILSALIRPASVMPAVPWMSSL